MRLGQIFSCGCPRLCSPVESMQLAPHAHCGRQLRGYFGKGEDRSHGKFKETILLCSQYHLLHAQESYLVEM